LFNDAIYVVVTRTFTQDSAKYFLVHTSNAPQCLAIFSMDLIGSMIYTTLLTRQNYQKQARLRRVKLVKHCLIK